MAFTADDYRLQGVLHLPRVPRPPLVIGAHGLMSDGNSPKQIAVARECRRRNIAFFRFDHRGCGRSQGVFQEVTSLAARCRDLLCALEAIRSRADVGEQLGLFGSSMGGAVCIAAAALLEVKAMVTVAAPVHRHSVIAALEKAGDAPARSPLLDEGCFPDDIVAHLPALHHILIFHGDNDLVVPPSNALEIYDRAGQPKKLILQKGGDHRMSNPENQKVFLKATGDWFQACFEGRI